MHTVLITPYLNTRGFVHLGPPKGYQLQSLAPREAVPALAEGRALAGVVPVGGLRQLKGQVNYLGAYGISCPGPAQSVLFFSEQPFDAFDETMNVALTTDSMTSVRLLYLLFAYRQNGRGLPRAVAPGRPAEGELVIGDRALALAKKTDYPYVVDLAEAWLQRHGRPMVFARWVISKKASGAARAQIHEWLASFAKRESELLDRAANSDFAPTGLSPSAARRYLDGIRTVLKEDDLIGQRIYEQDLARFNHFPFLNTTSSGSPNYSQVKS